MLITTILPLSLSCRQTALLLLLCLVKSLAKKEGAAVCYTSTQNHHLGNFRTNAICNAIYLQKVNFQQGSYYSITNTVLISGWQTFWAYFSPVARLGYSKY